MELTEAFDATDSAVAVVGAGGKKTTMYALADRLDRAVLTASVRIPIFDPHVQTVTITDTPTERITAADTDAFPLGVVPARERDDRYLGYDPDVVDAIIEAHDGPVLVKADGARMREFKAPGENEPRIPSRVDVVVPVASASVIGTPLTDDRVHRPARVVSVAEAAGIDIGLGDPITPELVGTVLASPEGGLAGVPPDTTVIPLLNKVDDASAESRAREAAAAFARSLADASDDVSRPTVPHVVLGRLIDGRVVDTVDIDRGSQ